MKKPGILFMVLAFSLSLVVCSKSQPQQGGDLLGKERPGRLAWKMAGKVSNCP